MIECDLPHLSNGNWIPPVVHFRISFSSFFFFYSTSKTYQLYLQNKFRIWLLLTISTVGQSHHHILPGFFYLPGFRTLAFSPASEKAMAPHSSTLAWKIPWTEEPGRLQSLLRVRHDWATSLSLFTFMHWRRNWQPTPVFLPGESQGRGSLVGCHLRGRTESDMTEVT